MNADETVHRCLAPECPYEHGPDPRTAALAEALHKARCAPSVPWPAGHMERHIEDAAAILAALPADWCGHDGPFAGIPEGWVAIPSTDRARGPRPCP